MNALRIFALAAVLAVSIVPSAAAEPDADPAEAMADRINAARAHHDLPALRVAPKLMHSSRSFAKHLARTGSFNHGSSFRSTGFRQAGEMLAYALGHKPKLGGPIRMWLHSPVHRGLMLSRAFRYVGASPARASGAKTVWVVHFGAH